ncbi:MAG: dehypoxanthine futalosine cyclase [Chlamydiia bacterium]|nr:dehypoxanthine futalosine cyclase [Chlamydiia bacterium]
MQSRLSFDDGLRLFIDAPLEELQQRAVAVRNSKVDPNRVTFVLDSNPNYTNICNADCSFCAFYRHAGAKDAYLKDVDQVMEHFEKAHQAGLSTVLLQGGLTAQPLEYYTEIIRRARRDYPGINPHCFSAPEIWNCAKVNQLSIREVLQALWDAGQRSIPGGGAEILSERVRTHISPKKMEPHAWMEVHETAHDIGFVSTATMMYGHVETPEDILIHLDVLRRAQDRNPGFTAFIPWSYKRERTALRRSVKNWAGQDAYFRILAFARIYLDNFDHIQATWFSEGKEVGIQSLHYGADDFGGIIMEENVHRAAMHINKADVEQVTAMIRKAGFVPAERTTFYDILKMYDGDSACQMPEAQRVKEEDRMAILGQW